MSNVLIIGAGSMGLASGYFLNLAGANVTFLIRSHHKKDLNRPQLLYNLAKNTVNKYTGYDYITEPSRIATRDYDFIVITLDRIALQSEEGTKLTKIIGEAVKGKQTKIILGTVTIGVFSWFLKTSGILPEMATEGSLGVMCYPPKKVELPVYAEVDKKALANADAAWIDCFGRGFSVSDFSPSVAKDFAVLFNKCGVSRCAIKSIDRFATDVDSCFVIFAGSQLLGWPKFSKIDAHSELWGLTTAAFKEIEELDIHGEIGSTLARETTEEKLASLVVGWEKSSLPLDIQEFNKYHHGGKVNAQDRIHLNKCLLEGEREGKRMTALREILKRLEWLTV
ncbi:hypothetical protein FOA43_001952 [Brettanomyces nanus]|uniref:Ketopantoate reductase N-terminal domain-containing protein n=1 Tax=Eeniella nana TaxID=13502 RepID=A0A875RP59_EENNA|nr:uncharacterized protein FOA43_001952 [Brettanomyces nanus]QPG74620.1 hypothetical protein FOA43_001952 [Brettanomyces nanus]